MLRIRRARPHLETLENRVTPATIKLTAGSLFITNIVGGVTGLEVKATATPGKFDVTDAGKTVTVSGVSSLISITGGNAKDKITFNLNGKSFTGNLLINSGNGDDNITILGGGAGSKIGGNVNLQTGLGTDDIDVSNLARIGGSFTAYDSLGSDFITLGLTVALTVGGDVNLTGFNGIGIGSNGLGDMIGGNLSITAVADGNTTIPAIANGVVIGKNLTIAGSSTQFDSVNLDDITVNGNASVSLGNGVDNFFELGDTSTAGSAFVGGNLDVTGGDQGNALFIESGTTIGGNLRFTLGGGANTIQLGAAPDLTGVNVNGNLYMTIGNGDNAGPAIVNAVVGGSMNFNLGNGSNDFLIPQAPGGKFNWTSGSGTNQLRLGVDTLIPGFPDQNFDVNIRFGSGDDTLVIDIGATGLLTGFIDFDGDSGAGDTFLVLTGNLAPTLVIMGLP